MSRKLNDNEKQEIISLYLSRVSVLDIAKKYNKTIQCIYYILKKNNIYQKRESWENYIGEKYNRLTIVDFDHYSYSPNGARLTYMRCLCDCGSLHVGYLPAIRNGNIKSCGCYKEELQTRGKNQYDLSGEYGIGYTSKGEEFYFDLEDYNKIKDYTWYYGSQNYVCTHIIRDGVSTNLRFHRLILNLDFDDTNIIVDHINRNIQDNRKSNLRLCNKQQNGFNRGSNKNNILGIKGVSKSGNKYVANISFDGQGYYIGTFDTIEDAQNARIKKEKELIGEFAYTGG